MWWILLRALTRVLADEKLLKTWDWKGNNGEKALLYAAPNLLCAERAQRDPGLLLLVSLVFYEIESV